MKAAFKILYVITLAIMFAGSYYILGSNEESKLVFYEFGLIAGKISLVLFFVVLLPGIYSRFKAQNLFVTQIALYRREVGVLMFLYALIHYLFLSVLPSIYYKIIPETHPFTMAGFFALLVLLPLFITSNNFSQRLLKRNWKKLHRLIYIGMFLILAHVGLQRFSVWTLLMVIIVILEVASFVFIKTRKQPQ